jgi:Cu/Ag efflux pump CusA
MGPFGEGYSGPGHLSLTTALLGIPGVETIRSTSMFGMSFIYIIFRDNVEFYWSRSRLLEKLSSLPPGTLPDGVSPALGLMPQPWGRYSGTPSRA